MIVLLNGPFGIGKTTTARLLVDRLPGSILYDPEDVGAYLRHLLRPVEDVGDYQTYAIWRPLVVEIARQLHETYEQPLVIPMTVWRRDLFDALVAGLAAIGPELHCIRLTASRPTLIQRILECRGGEGERAWRLEHLDAGLDAFADPALGIEVATEGRAQTAVADAILDLVDRADRRRDAGPGNGHMPDPPTRS